MSNEQGNLRGHPVVGSNGEVIGTVSDVFSDDHVNGPKWLVVDPGLFRKERLVPIEGSYETEDGTLVLPYDKKWVTHGPAVDREHYPDAASQRLAQAHYHAES